MTLITSFLLLMIKQYIGLKNGMKALLKNEIIRVYDIYINQGYCPSYIKENIKEIYENYHVLKGNGMASSMVNDIYKLSNEPRENK